MRRDVAGVRIEAIVLGVSPVVAGSIILAALVVFGAAVLNFSYVALKSAWAAWRARPAAEPSLRRKRWAFGLFCAALAIFFGVGLWIAPLSPDLAMCAASDGWLRCGAPMAAPLAFGGLVLGLGVDPFDPFGYGRERRGAGRRTAIERRLFGLWAASAIASVVLFQFAIG